MRKTVQTLVFMAAWLLVSSFSPQKPMVWSPFEWQADTISGRNLDKAFIYVPVNIDNLPFAFTMQLDLGSSETQFYGTALQPYLAHDPSLANKATAYREVEDAFFKGVCLHLGPADATVDVWHRHGFGDNIPPDSLRTPSPKHIGTIGSDLFADKVLVIDYPSRRFALCDTLPEVYAQLPAVPFELDEGLIKLPFVIDGKARNVLFDTGSSPFELVTTKEQALAIADPVMIDSLSGPLWWGQQITFYGFQTNKPIVFAGQTRPHSRVYYDKEQLWAPLFEALNVWGITGNAYFFDRVVVIDYKNKLFRVQCE